MAKYFCRVRNECGKTTDSGPATATRQCEPTFFQQPQSQKSTNPGHQQIFLFVSVGSDMPVTYQWYASENNGPFSAIAGATDSSLTVMPSVSTLYYCTATNSCGTSQSYYAFVTVCYAPVITEQPQSQTVASGTNVTLSVAANSPSGDPLRYQWYLGLFDPQAIQGATGPTLSFNAQFSGEYSVRVTNDCTDTWSDIASVSISNP